MANLIIPEIHRLPAKQAVAAKSRIFWLALFWLCPAYAGVYTYTDGDGMIYLSNMPANNRYRLLLLSPDEQAEETATARLAQASASLASEPQYNRAIEEAARIYGLDSALLHAVISVESRHNPKAVSNKGATGLMQLMPATAKRYGVKDLFDPVQNLHGGAKYLRDMLTLFKSDVNLALAAYNAGENAVVRHGYRIPPYRETMNYVPRVLDYYRRYKAKSATGNGSPGNSGQPGQQQGNSAT